jgi:hypothetical protein
MPLFQNFNFEKAACQLKFIVIGAADTPPLSHYR